MNYHNNHNNHNNNCKIPNSDTSATSHSSPNTIMMRDSDCATRLSSIMLKGADYIKSNISSEFLTKGFLYFSNRDNNHYAILRNTESDDCLLNLSLEFGQNNEHGNFSILTEQATNFTVRNNMVGINNADPQYTLDVDGSIRSRGLQHAGPVHSDETGVLHTVGPYHITDLSYIPFTNSVFVFEIVREITLPTNKYDGYVATFINKSGGPIQIRSSEPMFNIFYLPDGGNLFILDNNRRIDALYTITNAGGSWSF
jgi:hypothetical protein